MPTERWEEESRREVGVSTRTGEHVGASFVILYEVTEVVRDKSGTPVKWRDRLVPGQPLYQKNNGFLGTAALLEVVAKGVEALQRIARVEDERISAARRATPRRKRR